MAASFKAHDGSKISDGDQVTLLLRYGDYTEDHERAHPEYAKAGEPVGVKVSGIVREFDHVERVYDEEHIAIGKSSEKRWEIVTDDLQHPAVGFLPENVLARLS